MTGTRPTRAGAAFAIAGLVFAPSVTLSSVPWAHTGPALAVAAHGHGTAHGRRTKHRRAVHKGPIVLSAGAEPGQLPAGGGQVTVVGSVRGAKTCRLAVLGDHGIKVSLPAPAKCMDGQYGKTVGFGPDKGLSPVTVKLGLFAGTARGVFYVVVAGRTHRAVPAALDRSLPPGTTVELARAHGALHAHTSYTSVSAVGLDIHGAKAPAGSRWRLAVYGIDGRLVATAPYGAGRFLLHFSRPVPAGAELSLGVQEHWAGRTWLPAGIPTWFDVARSPVVVNLGSGAAPPKPPARHVPSRRG